ncbi:hypothetical protein GGH12_002110 [Coemansia sp. RSA 1822]|nr:hypothetical protein LPJ76_002570 [Coemansia sp. RSA 638]KAJ2543300.1 hypothetical protein GGF49_002186 [Coemansia sp. RSA 1853]KAJ2564230.1 hypothetical protein GGH12_002110 [Coemansia sp. RSA 1822]
MDNQLVASWETVGSISMVSKPTPTLKPGDVLVRVAASGICGTDLHICKGETPHARNNVTIGHEFSGYVEAIHAETTTTAKIGDLVAIDPNVPCNKCTFCRTLKYHLCLNLWCIGVTCDGGMAKYVAVPASAIYVTAGISPEVASLAEPLSCVVHAVDTGSVKSGDRVLVIGAGPIGLMVTALCASGGAHVTVAELNATRRTAATEFGASVVTERVDIGGDPIQGYGFDVVFECVGLAATMSEALEYARAGGTIVWVGVATPTALVSVSPFTVYRRELTIKSTYTNPFGMERAVRILCDNKVNWANLISHTFALTEFDAAWAVFVKNSGLKVCIKP